MPSQCTPPERDVLTCREALAPLMLSAQISNESRGPKLILSFVGPCTRGPCGPYSQESTTTLESGTTADTILEQVGLQSPSKVIPAAQGSTCDSPRLFCWITCFFLACSVVAGFSRAANSHLSKVISRWLQSLSFIVLHQLRLRPVPARPQIATI